MDTIEQIIVNPTRAWEPQGTVLLDRENGMLEYDGVRIPADAVKDISFTNVANAYLTGDYHIILTLQDGRTLHIPAGMDRTFAMEAAQQLWNEIKLLSDR